MVIWLLAIAIGFCILRIWFSPTNRLQELGNKIPGPKPYPIVGNIFNFKASGIKAIKHWEDGMKEYGNTFRYWIGQHLYIFISEPEDIQLILSSSTLISKSVSYKNLIPWFGTGLLISSGDLWQRRRKAITPTFHFKILETFIPTFSKCAGTLVKILKEKAGIGPFQITNYLSNCALDAITETAMGTELNAQTNPHDEYPSSILRMTKLVGEKLGNPFMTKEPFYTLSGKRKRDYDLLKILSSLPLKLVKKRVNEKNKVSSRPTTTTEVFGSRKKTAFLELLLEMKNKNVPGFQTDKDINDEVITFMFEGHDTTTTALNFTVWLLGQHPQIQEELYQELSEMLGEQEPSMEDYQKMRYLDRIIKESLRLYPPVPAISRVATEDIILPSSGYVVPAGAQLSFFIYTIHRRADLFPEPNKFNPDRFLHQQKHSFAYIPFSAGPRNCIGQKFAMLELKVIISKLVLNYKIHSMSEHLDLTRDLLLRFTKEPNVSITLRK